MTPPTPGTPRPDDRLPTEPTLVEPPTGGDALPPTLAKSLPATTGPVGSESCEALNEPSSCARSRYRTLRLLGKGGLGEVFVALDEELNREVALKEIQQRHGSSDDCVVRFLLEAEVTGRLEHPGVVPVYGLGRYPDGRPYYAMRLIKAETLHQAIERFHETHNARRDPSKRGRALRDLLHRVIHDCNA